MFDRLLRPLLTWRRLDLRSARARLTRLGARHVELSAIVSADDDVRPNDRLLDLAQATIERARGLDLKILRQRRAPDLAFTWPGEHYRLLAALVDVLRPRTIVEVGTHQGLSALAMAERLPARGRLVTFDVVPWDRIDGTFLRRRDFHRHRGLRLEAVTADLGDPAAMAEHGDLLRRAELVFLDAAKDGALERRLLDNLAAADLPPGAIVVLDDVRVWNMLDIWREIERPKLDLTSFGHWSGTGLIDWRPPRQS